MQCVAPGAEALMAYRDIDIVPREDIVYGECIGKGSFSRVWSAVLYHVPVAVKQLTSDHPEAPRAAPDQARDLMLHELFQEVKMLKALRHPHVLAFHGVCIEPPLLITEHCRVGSLWDMIQAYRNAYEHGSSSWDHSDLMEAARKVLSWPGRVKVVLDAAIGMAYLHSDRINVLHRDVKTPNLLLDQHFRCKVGDLGLARSLTMPEHQDASGAGQLTLNALWAAPEVLNGGDATKASDVFSFSVVMWELLMVDRPWPQLHPKDALAVVFRVGELGQRPQVPQDLSKVPAGGFRGLIPAHERLPAIDQYVDLMQRCWAQDPNDRPDFREIVRTLQDTNALIEAECTLGDGVPCSMSLMHDALLRSGYAGNTSGILSVRSSETAGHDLLLSRTVHDMGHELGNGSPDEELP